jgi:ParB-like chromosome segregation protein Spo0J
MREKQPIDNVIWVPIEKIESNNYNPNSVARTEMQLLYISIFHDGYTQPIVTIYDEKKDKYVIVDGFHRYMVCKTNKDIYERNEGKLPIVVIDKDINDRMASTVRHNRARGKHSIQGMSSMVFKMLDNGWEDKDICNELGMEAEELLKLKHITGFSKLFENIEYKKAWESRRQIKIRFDYQKNLESK